MLNQCLCLRGKQLVNLYVLQVTKRLASDSDLEDQQATSSDDDTPLVSCSALGKLRLPRSLLEKWVEEPFFEKAVVGCFVRLGVGKDGSIKLFFLQASE